MKISLRRLIVVYSDILASVTKTVSIYEVEMIELLQLDKINFVGDRSFSLYLWEQSRQEALQSLW